MKILFLTCLLLFVNSSYGSEYLIANKLKKITSIKSLISWYPIEERFTNPFDRGAQDSILNNIQEKISQAANEAFIDKNTYSLDKIENQLKSADLEDENLKNYWIGYVNYYKTIVGLKIGDEDLCRQASHKGITVLEQNKVTTSEDYALLALLKGLSFSFSSGMKAPVISSEAQEYIKKGLEADSTNFRVHYAQARLDFYMPKEYGGGKKAEKHLLKAVELQERNIDNPRMPRWGKEEVYDLLIRYYLREEQKDSAQKYFDEAKRLFPNSYVVSSHQQNFQE